MFTPISKYEMMIKSIKETEYTPEEKSKMETVLKKNHKELYNYIQRRKQYEIDTDNKIKENEINRPFKSPVLPKETPDYWNKI